MTSAQSIQQPSFTSVWLKATRPATLLAGVVPVIVGSALAARDGVFEIGPAIACVLGAVLLQIGCNFANDLFDFLNGADNEDRIGPARMTVQGNVSTQKMAWATALSMVLATLVGVYLVWVAGLVVVWIGVAGIAAGIFYTAGPRPLGYMGLGELLVFTFFGLAAVGGTYYVMADSISLGVLLMGGSMGSLASAILVVNNLRDRHTDEKAGKRTLAVRMGEKFTRNEYIALVGLAYLPPVYIAWTTAAHGALLCWITVPLAIRVCLRFQQADGAELNPFLGKTAKLETAFGLCFAAGVLL